MVESVLGRPSGRSEISLAIDGVVHNFMLADSGHTRCNHTHLQTMHSSRGICSFNRESIKEAIEHRSYTDRYYRKMNHNEFSAMPIPARASMGFA